MSQSGVLLADCKLIFKKGELIVLRFFYKFFLPICFYFPGHSLADVDLLYCIDQAIQENSELKKNRSEFYAIKESEKQSFASLLPSVGISVSRSQVNQERSDGSGLNLDQEYIMENDSISLRQPIYRPKLVQDLKKVRKEIDAEKALLLNKENIFKMRVTEAYFRLLRAYSEEALLVKRKNLLNEQKKAAIKSIEAGRGTITELAEINAANDKASVDLIRARQNIRLELNELQFYTGEKITKIKALNETEENFSIFGKHSVSYWEKQAVSNNYELRSKQDRIAAARIAIHAEKLNRYPTLDLNMQLSRGSSESTFFVDSETKSSSIGLSFFLPLYQGGSIGSRVRQFASQLDAEIEGLKVQEEDLIKRVQKTYYSMSESNELRDALKSAIKSAEIELESTKKSTEAGIRKQLDVLISQQKALGIERDFIEVKLNIFLYWLNLNMLSSKLDRTTIKTVNSFLR